MAGHCRPRSDRHHSLEGQRTVFDAARDFDLGLVDGVDLVLSQSLPVILRKRLLEGFLASSDHADTRLQEFPGRLARSEAGDSDLSSNPLKGGIDGTVELCLINGDRQLNAVAVQAFKGCLHSGRSVPAALRGPTGRAGRQRIVNGLAIGSVEVLIQTVLVVVNSWIASTPASRPDPLLPNPPNGAIGEMAR